MAQQDFLLIVHRWVPSADAMESSITCMQMTLYIEFSPSEETDAGKRLEACILEIRDWMKKQFSKAQ